MGVNIESHFDQVCLVQLASEHCVLILDAIELGDDTMRQLLDQLVRDHFVSKVIHSDNYALDWFHWKFSIQVGHCISDAAPNAEELDGRWQGERPSLQRLCCQHLHSSLETLDETADWNHRPIPAAMLSYAATRVQVRLSLQAAIVNTLKPDSAYEAALTCGGG